MPIFRELAAQIAAASRAAMSLEELHDWLAGHVQVIADSRDARAQWLADQAWIRMIDYADGRRDAASVRRTLGELLDLPASKRPAKPMTAS